MPLWKAAPPEVYVADAALYSQENLEALGKTPWISRVPATIAEAQQLMQSLPPEMFTSIGQRQLRSSLAQAIETSPNQRGKPTERPTLRRVLQCFQSVHLVWVWVSGRKWSIKLTDT